MTSLARDGGRARPLGKAFALALGACVLAGPRIAAEGGWFDRAGKKAGHAASSHHAQEMSAHGTLGYGPPGIHAGFQGFGLGFHPGHGYGGGGLGVGADGGYPFYGGPGYPQCGPPLLRHKGIAPFPYHAGPGFPTPGHPNYFGPVGPLYADPPVVRPMGAPEGDYGQFTGVLPYPENTFTPFPTAGQSTPSR
jgi:hypothetical protein